MSDRAFSCAGCGGTDARSHLVFRERSILECATCGLFTTWPRLDAGAARRRYAQGYYSGDGASRFRVGAAERIMRVFRRRRARQLARELGGAAGKRVLDIGCGRGETLLALKNMGADVFGTQVSPQAARAAADRIGAARVFVGDLADAAYPVSSFDAVTLWHVLEHVTEPLETLREIAWILKPDGLVYIEVPNAGGTTARSFGTDWLAYDVAHHTFHFTPESLAALARRAGLAPVREAHLSLEHSPVTLTQTWINRALGGDNRLFRSLTYDDDPDAPRGRVPLPIHFATAAACLPFAVLVSLWLARRGTGDTYGAYFRRVVPPS